MERMTEYELGWWDSTAARHGSPFGDAVRRLVAEVRSAQGGVVVPREEVSLHTTLDAKAGTRVIIAGPITKRAVEALRLYPDLLADVARPDPAPTPPVDAPEPSPATKADDPATTGCATCGEKGWPHYDRMPSGIWICSECHHAIRTHYTASRDGAALPGDSEGTKP